jgi:hypothetical protein
MMERPVVIPHVVAWLLLASAAHAQVLGLARVLDDFESVSAWTAHPSDGVAFAIGQDAGYRGRGMRLDFDFRGGGGYGIARRTVAVEVSENYEFTFWIRGEAPVNTLEFKLVDPSGENVWWSNQRNFEFPREWRKVTLKRRHISFAWGPLGGGELKRVAAIEIAITAAKGGKGTVFIDDLALTPLEPVRPYDLTPRASASSAMAGHEATRVVDGDTTTEWRSGELSGPHWLAIDFQRAREYGGLVVTWAPGAHASDYVVETSADGRRWEPSYRVQRGNGGRDYIWMPETESRYARLRMTAGPRPGRYALRELAVQPLAWSASKNAFFESIARAAAPGTYPKYFAGVQSYWTVIGVDGDDHEALINEEGMIEAGKLGFSVEPFIRVGERFITWHDVTRRQSLEQNFLPIPSVDWDAGDLALTVTADAVGRAGASSVIARYRVRNNAPHEQRVSLFLALRPFQVNPPWQFLNAPGGVARVRGIAYDVRGVRVDGDGARRVVPLTPPSRFAAATFDEGDVVETVRAGRSPTRLEAFDSFGHASAVLEYELRVLPGSAQDVYIEIPFQEAAASSVQPTAQAASSHAQGRLAASRREWDEKLGRATIELPAAARRVAETIRSTVAYILINRDGAAIHPGSRSYERSWIRDGSLTSAALLRLGHADAVRAFAEWYAPHQYENGKVPCCVDARGADPVPEHDSHGQLIYLIAEYYRHTRDRAFVERLWPHVARAVAYIDTLRRQRMTPEFQTGEKRAYYGILPPSISHEGYSAKPMHSYWDDFFALRGLKDAAELAGILGRTADAHRLGTMRDELRRDLLQSFRLAMANHKIDFLPGSVELGDFDATSTTVGIAPGGEESALPRAAVERTFDRYYRSVVRRPASDTSWEAYTPYEWRTVGTFVRLGWKERAHELLEMFFADARPAAWNHWAEVVWRDPHAPKFIGDMPHTWVGSDFIRSVLDMFAYERESDSSLVVGAGIPESWVIDAPGVVVRGLSTHYGKLDLSVRAQGDVVRIRVAGAEPIPRGGVVIRTPLARRLRSATVDGRPVSVGSGEIIVRALPADVVFQH